MTTSGDRNFGYTTQQFEVLEEAWERCGKYASQLSGNDFESARRSLAFLMQSDWSNRQPNLWTITQTSTALTQGQEYFDLNPYDIYITESFTRMVTGAQNQDLIISPMSRSEYAAIPNKAQQSTRPTQFYLQRTITPRVYIWPTCQQTGTVTLYYNVAQMIQDPGAMSNTIDAPNRWFDALAAELAARLAMKWVPDRYMTLASAAEKSYSAAAAEDTENVPMRVTPDMLGRRQ